MARLCLVLYGIDTSKKKKQRESIALAWVNTPLFDFRGHLRQGIVNLTTWPVTETLPEKLNPIGTVVSNINTTTSPTVLIEFQRYSNTVVYPPYDMIVQLAAENTKQESFIYFSEDEVEKLKKIIQKEPLSPIFENDKEFVWKLRIECRENYPYALGKLLSCVKWHCKEDVAQMQVLLQIWTPLEPEMALELLDYNYADQRVREFAVRCIEKMCDSDLEQYMLQLVQVLKYENYLDCDLAKFLLKRALKNQNIGHILFWLLKAEMHNPEVSIRFGLMLEAYLRGAPEHMKKLQKQVEALSKLKMISTLLRNVDGKNKEKGLNAMRQSLQQKTYMDAFSKLTSPLDPSFRLRQLKIDKCKFMDSKMKPLWLNFDNFDELGGPVKIIFKSGDDLRQDMLTLQLIRVMDRLWKQNGLDLEMIPYGCLCTGNNVGLIQVVDNSETLAKIQKKQSGAISGAFGKTCLWDWLSQCNEKEQMEEVTRKFTLSCAGYCVATYVLGIGDRHSDNIMVTKTGQVCA
ncbi:phosphatidylinositol 4,5-bisphosphate 3-kinase catalytic subunit beta isoform [Exaiptasia diaphana]|uniref:phosphatidylinositol 3-kinase n=1 Tax=Exaiptasia diaphana TaxID=2652724 RepID=A0A913Y481_EXADI|nr:phosphatidylinositol 4,5-bisphosphate 3-kinase catalytic subunit beta isoform [Exaiptasia diaphana]